MITEQPLTTGIWLKTRILGVLKFVDGGEVDDKIIVVPEDDRNNGDRYQTLEDLPKQTLEQIKFHFNHYKDLKKPGTTEVKEILGAKEAKEVIKAAIERYIEEHPEVKARREMKETAAKASDAIKSGIDAAKKALRK